MDGSGRKRTERVTIRLRPHELARLRIAASTRHERIGEFLRASALSRADRVITRSESSTDD